MKKKAILLGVAPADGHVRITTGDDFIIRGGDKETHEQMQDTAMRFQEELKKRGKTLGEMGRTEFAELIHKAGRT